MPSPALGRLRKEAVDEEVDSFVEKNVASSSFAAATLEPANSSPSPSESSIIPPSIPSPQPIKRPPISPEEKQKLESQLHAARLLQKATIPARKRQLKPAVIAPVKKPNPQHWMPQPDQADDALAEEKQVKTGFLAKLASLFGR
jgi:hypothetical protein